MTERRHPGRRGRLPARAERLPLRYAHTYLAEPLPAPVYPIDVSGGITDWGMLGNDIYGDCAEAGLRHGEMATAACAGEPVPQFTTAEAVTEYLDYTGGQDCGVNLEDFLLWLYQHGRIKGFAPIDHTDRDLCDAMLQQFRGLYCVAPETKILTADLRWIPAQDIAEGQALVGFDENGPRRRYRRSVVTRTQILRRPCYDLTFSDGTQVRCSSDHMWLWCGKSSYGSRLRWIRTDEMQVGLEHGTTVVRPLEVWQTETTYEAGYLAAAFDGEGCLKMRAWSDENGTLRHEVDLTFVQRDNAMLANVEQFLKTYGFPHGIKSHHGGTYGNVGTVGVYRRSEIVRLLGMTRPERLLAKFRPDYLGLLKLTGRVTLIDRKFVGEQNVVAITTTTGTFLAEGLASHNCGVSLTDDADEKFANHEPWTVADGQQPDPNDGHCIWQVKADGADTDVYVTWGGDQPATTEWTAACREEAYVVWTTEDPAVLWDELLTDLDALHGVHAPKAQAVPGGGNSSTGSDE